MEMGLEGWEELGGYFHLFKKNMGSGDRKITKLGLNDY